MRYSAPCTTVAAAKIPQGHVGILINPASAAAHVAVLTKVRPDSIFAAHRAVLENQVLVAVGGVSVQNPQHAAEMVRQATGKVELAVRRGVKERGRGTDSTDSEVRGKSAGGGWMVRSQRLAHCNRRWQRAKRHSWRNPPFAPVTPASVTAIVLSVTNILLLLRKRSARQSNPLVS